MAEAFPSFTPYAKDGFETISQGMECASTAMVTEFAKAVIDAANKQPASTVLVMKDRHGIFVLSFFMWNLLALRLRRFPLS
jgi:hypothetical protein